MARPKQPKGARLKGNKDKPCTEQSVKKKKSKPKATERQNQPPGTTDFGGFSMVIAYVGFSNETRATFVCNTCKKEFTRKKNAREHLKLHTNEKAYLCNECGKTFLWRGDLKKHQRVHSGKKPFVCDFCGYASCRKGDLRRHRRQHTQEAVHVCHFCGRNFNRVELLRNHLVRHENEKKYFRGVYVRPCRKLTRSCDICYASFSNKLEYIKHILEIHKGEPIDKCEICAKEFFHRDSFLKHMHIHSATPRYKCKVCQKGFSFKGQLTLHMLTHIANGKDFLCENCGKGFTRRDSLKIHKLKCRLNNPKSNFLVNSTVSNTSTDLPANQQTVQILTTTNQRYKNEICSRNIPTTEIRYKDEKEQSILIEGIDGATAIDVQHNEPNDDNNVDSEDTINDANYCLDFLSEADCSTSVSTDAEIKSNIATSFETAVFKHNNSDIFFDDNNGNVEHNGDHCNDDDGDRGSDIHDDDIDSDGTIIDVNYSSLFTHCSSPMSILEKESNSYNTSGLKSPVINPDSLISNSAGEDDRVSKALQLGEPRILTEQTVTLDNDGGVDSDDTIIDDYNDKEELWVPNLGALEKQFSVQTNSMVEVLNRNVTQQHKSQDLTVGLTAEENSDPLNTTEPSGDFDECETVNDIKYSTESLNTCENVKIEKEDEFWNNKENTIAENESNSLNSGVFVKPEKEDDSEENLIGEKECNSLNAGESVSAEKHEILNMAESSSPKKKDDTRNKAKVVRKKRTRSSELMAASYCGYKRLARDDKDNNFKKLMYVCDTCGKMSDSSFGIKDHIRTHTGERPFSCNECEKRFARKSDLKKHGAVHSTEKPHICDVCGKAFARSSDLHRHRWIHTREIVHVCEICGENYQRLEDLRRHYRQHTGEARRRRRNKNLRKEADVKPSK